jgi:hypothetical protein
VEQVQHVVMMGEEPVPSGMSRCNCEAIRGGGSARGCVFDETASPCNTPI